MVWSAADDDMMMALRHPGGAVADVLIVSGRDQLSDSVAEAARRLDLGTYRIRAGGRLLDRLAALPSLRILCLDLDSAGPALIELAGKAARRFAGRTLQILLIAGEPVPESALLTLRPGQVRTLCEPVGAGDLHQALEAADARLRQADAGADDGEATALIARAAQAAEGLLTSLEALQNHTRSTDQPLRPRNMLDHVDAVIRARRARGRIFGADLFADPAWDMLLDLYAHHLRGQRVTVSSLCIAAAVPQTTALRRLEEMVSARLVVKERDASDGRRTFVRLTELSVERLNRFVQEQGFLP